MKNIVLCLLIFVSPQALFASKYRSYETTRMKSTCGAGVASVLMDEATVLNPAPLAFFNKMSFYIQRTSLEAKDHQLDSNPKVPHLWSFIVSDASGPLKGSLNYTSMDNFFGRSTRYAAAFASPIGPKSSMGVTYIRRQDDYPGDGTGTAKNSTDIVVGVLHAIDKDFTLGLTARNPFTFNQEKNFATLGTQYVYKGFITLLFDLGANYTADFAESYLYRAAAQFMILDELFLRFGFTEDKNLHERSNGIGISWVSPLILFDISQKFSKLRPGNPWAPQIQKIQETSFAISFYF